MKIKNIRKQCTVNNKQFVCILSIVYCLLSTSAFSQTLSLDSVLSRIEKNNPALLSYTNKINSANELVNSAKSWMPMMAGAQWGENPYSFDFKNNMYSAMFFAEQWIPNANKIHAKEDYLKSFTPIRQNEYGYLQNQFFAQAKEKYYERFVTEKKIQIIKENIFLMKSMIQISEKHMASGMGDLGSIYKMKAKLADAGTMLIHEENMAKSLTADLNSLMYNDLTQQFSIDTNNLVKNYKNKILLVSKAYLETKRSDIQKMNSEISSMKLNQVLTSMEPRPEYGLRFEHTAVVTGKERMYAAMVMIKIPIAPWSVRGYKSEAKAMGFEIQAMEQDKQAMLNMANQMVNMLILEMNSEYAEVDSYIKIVIPAYKKSFDANLLAYSQNTGDLMKAVLASDDLQMAQMKYLEHLGILLKAQAEYEREMQIR